MEKNNYSLKFTPIADEDLDEIYHYISCKLFAEGAAITIMNKIENCIMKLEHFPYFGSYVLDEHLKNKGYRKLVIENYIVFYLVNEAEKQVVIMRILFGASDYLNIL